MKRLLAIALYLIALAAAFWWVATGPLAGDF
jgi:hypothetical protein